MGWPRITYSDKENDELIGRLKKYVKVETIRIDLRKYAQYLKDIDYKNMYPGYYNFNFTEKTLEHFLAFNLLNLSKGERFIDIAAESSPHSKAFSRLTGCIGYQQDIMYSPGIHGRKIGGNASKIPVDNEYFQGALASCSIEHFEKNADIESMKEMARILSKGGKIVIIPLYLHRKPFCVTDPRYAVPGRVEFDRGIDVHCVKKFKNRHGRYYSPETLYERLIEPNLDKMNFIVYFIENFKKIHPQVYCRFCLVGEKKS
jgi:hypothetical protein